MKIPDLFESKLAENTRLRGAVYSAVAEFEAWFSDSKLPFFPDYTDHGIRHVENVLLTARTLIPERPDQRRGVKRRKTTAEDCLSSGDSAVLILATLFHDSAMHLSEAAVFSVIRGANSVRRLESIDSETWSDLWNRFYFSARRWSVSKRESVFGIDERGRVRSDVRDPFQHWNDLTEGDRKLIGEFIRTYHGRLAHEFAIFGIPGHKEVTLKLPPSLPESFRDLIGVVARSHTLSIRACVDYLGDRFDNKRQIEGVHAVFLMALLRVSDYLQIASRSREIVFRYKFISSPKSAVEHRVTQAVKDIVALHDDPESLQVDARPQDVASFLRLREWLSGIQTELDASWAALGEVYGRYSPLSAFGLRFRRIRSNLDNLSHFRSTVRYVPARICFDVVRPDLLALLVGPLYGDEPSFGVRELTQNAVDAVREYNFFVDRHPELPVRPRRRQECDVVVTLSEADEKGLACLTISDRGIGMTEEIVQDYFLRAGASFRSSEWWQREFETIDPVTETAASSVLRSGRFGVGALAAFLVGREITCETRHVTSAEGLRFCAGLDSEAIELMRDPSIPVGTSITVRVQEDIFKQLLSSTATASRPRQWDWYCFDYPSVGRFLPPKGAAIRQNEYSFDFKLKSGHWRRLETNLPYEVFWTLDNAPRLTCNGIFVSNSDALESVPPTHLDREGNFVFLSYPNVAVLDPDAALPLRLQRDGLRTDDYPFGRALVRDVLTDLLAWLLFHGPENQFPIGPSKLNLSPWLGSRVRNTMLVLAPDGYGLRLGCLLNNRPAGRVMFTRAPIQVQTSSARDTIVFGGKWEEKRSDDVAPIFLYNAQGKNAMPLTELHICSIQPRWDEKQQKYVTFSVGQEVEWEKSKYLVAAAFQDWYVLTRGDGPPLSIDAEWPPSETQRSSEVFLTEVALPDGCQFEIGTWYLDDLWQEYFGNDWIPYDRMERLATFEKAASRLRRYYTGALSEMP